MKTFKSAKIEERDYESLKGLSKETGHSIGFHMHLAFQNYMADVAPVWRQKVKEVNRKH